MRIVILVLPSRRKVPNSFLGALFRTLTVAPSVGLFSKSATKPTKPIFVTYLIIPVHIGKNSCGAND
jgi:hypothetical protein